MSNVLTCKHCGYEWLPRVANPKKCPNQNCGKPLALPVKGEQVETLESEEAQHSKLI